MSLDDNPTDNVEYYIVTMPSSSAGSRVWNLTEVPSL